MSTNAEPLNSRKTWLLSLDSWAVVAALLAGLADPRRRIHARAW